MPIKSLRRGPSAGGAPADFLNRPNAVDVYPSGPFVTAKPPTRSTVILNWSVAKGKNDIRAEIHARSNCSARN